MAAPAEEGHGVGAAPAGAREDAESPSVPGCSSDAMPWEDCVAGIRSAFNRTRREPPPAVLFITCSRGFAAMLSPY
ncbi:hypothetical protein ACP4OV_031281 [Aristida adscensionis]